jgi:hypothetical protein
MQKFNEIFGATRGASGKIPQRQLRSNDSREHTDFDFSKH